VLNIRISIPELWDFIHQIAGDFSYAALYIESPWQIHFKLRIVIGIDSIMVCILFDEI
jgi:hypothetical protein